MIVLPEPGNIMLFLTVATLLIVMPGPAVLYIMTKSIEHGYKAGIVSVLGIGVGGLTHVLFAGIGISAILVASATAFAIVKYLGAIYLIYLGIKKLVGKNSFNKMPTPGTKRQLSKIFYEGVLVNVLNPKTAIFFFAFLPQFVSLEKGGVTSQIIFLGLLFMVTAVLSDTLYVLVSGRLGAWMKNNDGYQRMQKYVIGAIYITLGLLTLSMSQPSNGPDKK
ncbi:LysE family translocator [Fulvivirgaceae bacterium BMA12]|uniref:LysE family translocator n=1 Tax=Agaribacillus aureus TaxID=3051825 RepID=A0ABT8LI17_9BACT|nr:LysE family translocator [Fulvivirgaceae bacterium BMA12]